MPYVVKSGPNKLLKNGGPQPAQSTNGEALPEAGEVQVLVKARHLLSASGMWNFTYTAMPCLWQVPHGFHLANGYGAQLPRTFQPASLCAYRLPCVTWTPLGSPVDPLVYWRYATRSGSSGGSVGMKASMRRMPSLNRPRASHQWWTSGEPQPRPDGKQQQHQLLSAVWA